MVGTLVPTNRTASISPDVNDPGYRNIRFAELAETYEQAAVGQPSRLGPGHPVALIEQGEEPPLQGGHRALGHGGRGGGGREDGEQGEQQERAAELGVTQDQLGYTLWAYSDGAFVDEFYLDDDKLDMYLYSTQGAIAKPADLQSVMLHTRDGAVQLSSLARVEEVVGVNSIRRVNGMRTVTLGIIPPRSVALESGVEIVKRDLIGALRERGEIPPEISTTITGASTALEETRAEMGGNFLLAIFIAYLLMVAVLSHWGYALVIMTTVPIGISGGLIGLWLLNAVGGNLDWLGLDPFTQPFDVITMLGFLILIGTVVNNPILIVERAAREIEEQGMGIREAVREATRTRLRPVMMSTITTVFGLSPLVLLPGAGAELYRGLGAIVLFGLLFSSFITLTVLPVLLTAFFKLAQRFSRAA